MIFLKPSDEFNIYYKATKTNSVLLNKDKNIDTTEERIQKFTHTHMIYFLTKMSKNLWKG